MPEVEKTEKITINLGLVDLGEIDLLVAEGFFANRTDFIRSAIRRQLETRASAVQDSATRRNLQLGTVLVTRSDLEALRNTGSTTSIAVLGLCTIDHDVTADLALATIDSIQVLGALRAPAAVKTALASRIS